MELNHKNQTPLHIALKNKSNEMGKLLIKKGADINSTDIINTIMVLVF